MTHLNLHEACMLEVSGELGQKARQHLLARLHDDPRALAEYETIKADYALLRGATDQAIPEDAKAQIVVAIKTGVHRQLRERKRQQNAEIRSRFTYSALTGISAVAACLIVTLSIVSVQHNRTQSRDLAVAQAEDTLRDYIIADSDNMTDVAIASLNRQITNADTALQQAAPVESSGNRAKLLDLTSPFADDDVLEDPSGT